MGAPCPVAKGKTVKWITGLRRSVCYVAIMAMFPTGRRSPQIAQQLLGRQRSHFRLLAGTTLLVSRAQALALMLEDAVVCQMAKSACAEGGAECKQWRREYGTLCDLTPEALAISPTSAGGVGTSPTALAITFNGAHSPNSKTRARLRRSRIGSRRKSLVSRKALKPPCRWDCRHRLNSSTIFCGCRQPGRQGPPEAPNTVRGKDRTNPSVDGPATYD